MKKLMEVVKKRPVISGVFALVIVLCVVAFSVLATAGGINASEKKMKATQGYYASINDNNGENLNRDIEASFDKDEGKVYLVIYKRSCIDCQVNVWHSLSVAKALKDRGDVVYSVEAPNSKGASEYPKALTDKVYMPSVNTPAIVEYKWEESDKDGAKLSAYRSWNVQELIQESMKKY